MAVILSFNYHEAEVLLNWYENSRIKSERFGSSRYDFPQEQLLVEKLNNPMLHSSYDPMDVEIMFGWMEKTLGPDIGEGKFYFPLEEEIYKKLAKAREQSKTEIKSESSVSRESAIQYADRLIYEKKIKIEEERQNQRQKQLQQRIKEKKEHHQEKKLRHRFKTHLEKLFHLASKKDSK
jgi:hypothetical protein